MIEEKNIFAKEILGQIVKDKDHLLKVLGQVFVVVDGDDDRDHLGSRCLQPFHIAGWDEQLYDWKDV